MNDLHHEQRPDPDRREALLCDRALGSLDAEGERELKAMASDDDTFELAAAAALRGAVRDTPAPAKAQSIMLGCAERYIANTMNASNGTTPDALAIGTTPTSTGWRIAAMTGWLAAAALVALLVYPQVAMHLNGTDPNPASPTESFARFTAEARDLQMVNWTPVDGQVRCQGDICWSTDLQRGYIRIRGLPANDPNREQYQLWIFCRYRPEKTPVDGGVFDIPAGSGEVLIPVHAKLHVGDVTAFAITREPPGGVVVSDRTRVVLLAKP